MMSFTCDTVWPLRLDLSPLECRQLLREKELLCYSDVVSVLRAQGPLNEDKKLLLIKLQKILSIGEDRNKAELRRAANNEKLATISEKVSGFDGYAEWAALGALKMPFTQRPIPRTIYQNIACQTIATNIEFEKELPQPQGSSENDLSDKHDDAISFNRKVSKDFQSSKTEKSVVNCSIATNTVCLDETIKNESVTSLDYNLHLLSEIATGESVQSVLVPEFTDCDIKPDTFSIHNQIEDIELPVVSEQSVLSQSSHTSANHIPMTSVSTNVLLAASNIKTLTNTGHDPNVVNQTSNATPMVIGNTSGQRYVLPRNTMSQSISLIATNQHRHQVSGYITQQATPSGTYLTLSNNQMRSPPSQQIGTTRAGQPLTQQVYIQNVSSAHHGLGMQQQTMDNLTSLGYTLQQRAVRAEQHPSNNKHNFIVRNLGSHSTMEADRNKRFMLVKGPPGGNNSLGPSTKKPKISNPSNRQPGRPPLMPAPSSAYTSRPYVANEIFHTNRTSTSVTSSSADGPLLDCNGLKVSPGINKTSTVTSSHVRPNSFYPVSRGNGLKRTNRGSLVQLGSGSNIRTIDTPIIGSGSSGTLRPKNIQPVISVVPLSPRGPNMDDGITSPNISSSATPFGKEENIEHQSTEKVPIMPVRVMSKNEVYANILERVNPPSMVSSSQTENKTQ